MSAITAENAALYLPKMLESLERVDSYLALEIDSIARSMQIGLGRKLDELEKQDITAIFTTMLNRKLKAAL